MVLGLTGHCILLLADFLLPYLILQQPLPDTRRKDTAAERAA